MTNVVFGTTEDVLEKMLKEDSLLAALTDALDFKDVQTLCVVVTALDTLLAVGAMDKCNVYAGDFHGLGGVEKLSPFQTHTNTVLSEKVSRLLDRYFYTYESTAEEEADSSGAKAQNGGPK